MPSNDIGASTTGGKPARDVTVEMVSRAYGNSVFGQAMPSVSKARIVIAASVLLLAMIAVGAFG